MATALPDAPAPAARTRALADIREAVSPLGHELEVLESALDLRPSVDLRGLRAVCEEIAGTEFAGRIRSVRGWRSCEDPNWIQIILLVEHLPDDPSGLVDNERVGSALESVADAHPELTDSLDFIGLGSISNGI